MRQLKEIEVQEQAAPGTPASGFGRLYAKTDGKIYFKDDAGTEYDLTATGSGGDPNYAPGSFSLATNIYRVMTKRLQLTTTQRLTLAGTARLRIT